MQSYADCPFFSATIAGTCITANIPRCLSSTMPNTTLMDVTLYDGQHRVQFSSSSAGISKYRIAGVLRGAKFFVEPFTCFNFLAHYVSVYPVLKTLRY